jgi:regulator of protease activity HflC (stomatin/prohibitin superfamily)
MLLLSSVLGGSLIVFGVILLFVMILGSMTVKIVKQSQEIVVERLGRYDRTLKSGLNILIPIIDRVANVVYVKEKVADFRPQAVITKDNVTMQIDTVVYFHIMDAKMYSYNVENPMSALENLTATTLRQIIGELELDQTLTSRDTINTKMRQIIDDATDPWGIKVNRIELKNILPPRDIQDSMEKQMRAERERRESVLRAEGEKLSKILVAEGEKESVILRAEAAKQSAIAEAQGRAEALRLVYEAQAQGVKLINAANPTPAYLTLEGFKALEKVADGQATKIIIPSELQNISGVLASITTLLGTDKPTK